MDRYQDMDALGVSDTISLRFGWEIGARFLDGRGGETRWGRAKDVQREIGIHWYLFSNHRTRKCTKE
jgi:hypothetical protein